MPWATNSRGEVKRFNGWLALWELITALLALAAGALAALTVIFISSPWAATNPEWFSEAVTGFAAAAAWMAVTLLIAGHNPATRVASFLVGAYCAWVLSREIVHSISPYYGLFTFIAACAGAALVWSIWTRIAGGRRGTVMAILVPLFTLGLGVAATLGAPSLGITRRVSTADGTTTDVPIAYAPTIGDGSVYLWSPRPAIGSAGEGDTVGIDLDSGPSPYRLVQTRDASGIRIACDHLRATARGVVLAEVSEGRIPRFLTKLPFNLADCEQGTVWRASPVQPRG